MLINRKVGNVVYDNIKDIKSSLRDGIRLEKGDIALVELSQKVADDKIVEDLLLMLVSIRQADDNKNKEIYELIEIGSYELFKFEERIFTNRQYKYDDYYTLNIIGKCDINLKIEKIHTYSSRYR